MEFTGIDHFVLTVEDVAASCAFYEALGGEIQTFGDNRKAVRFGKQKINFHPIENDVDFVAETPRPGAGDFCLVTETPIAEVERELAANDIEIITGPVERTGAAGPILSVYFRDLDNNLVEIASYQAAE